MKRSREVLWYSAGGIIALLAILIAINFIMSAFNARARDNAWMTAQTIQALQDRPFLLKQFMAGLARNVGFAGRGLLVRTQM